MGNRCDMDWRELRLGGSMLGWGPWEGATQVVDGYVDGLDSLCEPLKCKRGLVASLSKSRCSTAISVCYQPSIFECAAASL